MLAQLQPRLPRGDRWAYEPKLDGLRGHLWRCGDAPAQLLSRNGRDLAQWFPELARAAGVLPRGTLLDGEIVIADEAGQADFAALQRRSTLARKFIAEAVSEHPAILLVFDVLLLAEQQLHFSRSSSDARALETLLDGSHPCLQLVAHTTDIDVAEGWLTIAGLEGVAAERLDRPYTSGRARDWIRVKRQRMVECAVVGFTGDVLSPRLVLGLRHGDGQLHT
jgi:ATP-dependent DNA ligase